MSSSAFFSSDDAMTRKLECQSTSTTIEDINNVYSIKHCTQWIVKNDFSSVALQFPDDLLVDASRVAELIQEQVPNASIFILGDTSYGSCCVDEVGAQHYKADCIIHYGSTCLSPTQRIPVFYVLGTAFIDISDCVTKICQQCSDTAMKAVLAYDTKYTSIIGQVFQQLQTCLPHLILSKISLPSGSDHSQDSIYETIYPESIHMEQEFETNLSIVSRCGRVISLPGEEKIIDDYSVIFIGKPDGPTVINLMMNFNKSLFFTYDPDNSLCQQMTLNVNKALMKRYYLIERAKDASIIGILAGTLGVAKYRDIIEQLKTLVKKAGKKSYTFVVGKLNPQKLANFAEVEVYVLVSCPESCLFDQGDFHCPIVTPFEMEIACNKAREWTGDYTTDFSNLLPGSSMHIEAPTTDSYEEEGDVSLISNRLRVIGERNALEVSSSKDVVVRSEGEMMVAGTAQNASEFLSMRSWKGLEQNLGKTPVVKAVEGQVGIAASYDNEGTL